MVNLKFSPTSKQYRFQTSIPENTGGHIRPFLLHNTNPRGGGGGGGCILWTIKNYLKWTLSSVLWIESLTTKTTITWFSKMCLLIVFKYIFHYKLLKIISNFELDLMSTRPKNFEFANQNHVHYLAIWLFIFLASEPLLCLSRLSTRSLAMDDVCGPLLLVQVGTRPLRSNIDIIRCK